MGYSAPPQVIFRPTSTSMVSPSRQRSHRSGHSMSSRPLLMALRKKILAKLLAMMQRMPAAFRTEAAISREEPQPKFSPATMASPGRSCAASSGRRGSNRWGTMSSREDLARYLVMMMMSVSMLSPSRHTRLRNVCSMAGLLQDS